MELKELTQNWPELNRSFFWFEVDKTRSFFGRPLISYWQVLAFDGLCRFTQDDFPYAIEQIAFRYFTDKTLYLLMRQYIIPDEDTDSGSHRSLRQEGQRARDRLCSSLTEIEDKTVFDALTDIAHRLPEDITRMSLLLRAKFVAAREGGFRRVVC